MEDAHISPVHLYDSSDRRRHHFIMRRSFHEEETASSRWKCDIRKRNRFLKDLFSIHRYSAFKVFPAYTANLIWESDVCSWRVTYYPPIRPLSWQLKPAADRISAITWIVRPGVFKLLFIGLFWNKYDASERNSRYFSAWALQSREITSVSRPLARTLQLEAILCRVYSRHVYVR